ncbi:glycosyltransferase family 4 protein, partial [bacterium]|nr:glycosyltransferase family 4 protein [candidate division CSSED10-310 bacterium]
GRLNFNNRITTYQVYKSKRHFRPALFDQARLIKFLLSSERTESIYHYFFTPNRKTSAMARYIGRKHHDVKTVHTITSFHFTSKPPASYFFADELVAVSETSRNRIQHIVNRPVNVITPGIPIPLLPTADQKTALKQKYFLQDKCVVLYPGDWAFSQAENDVVELSKMLLPSFPDIVIVFACRMKTDNDTFVEERVRQSLGGFGNRVRFLREVSVMSDLINASDIVIFPVRSLYAKMDFPLVLLESMAASIPVVASDLPHLSELQNDQPQFNISLDDKAQWVTILKRLIDDHTFRMESGAACRAKVQQKFRLDDMAARYDALYARLLNSRNPNQ